MNRIDKIKSDLRLASQLKVMQDVQVELAREQWENAVKERDETKKQMQELLEELWTLQEQTPVVSAV
jgi:hypothetical protein